MPTRTVTFVATLLLQHTYAYCQRAAVEVTNAAMEDGEFGEDWKFEYDPKVYLLFKCRCCARHVRVSDMDGPAVKLCTSSAICTACHYAFQAKNVDLRLWRAWLYLCHRCKHQVVVEQPIPLGQHPKLCDACVVERDSKRLKSD